MPGLSGLSGLGGLSLIAGDDGVTYLYQVASRVSDTVNINSFSGASFRTLNQRTYNKIEVACAGLKLIYNHNGSASITIHVGIEKSGVVTEVTWAGATTKTLTAGSSATSDMMPFALSAGDVVYIRTFVSTVSSSIIVSGTVDNSGYGESCEYGAALSDKSQSGTIPYVTNRCYSPCAILGRVSAIPPAVLVFGDSIVGGANDDAAGFASWPFRLFNASGRPSIKSGLSGETMANFQLQALRTPLAAFCKHAVVAWGVNDITNGSSLATLQANATTRFNQLAALGCQVWATTLTPKTTSTDSWATTVNQTPAANFGPASIRTDYNAWVRTLPSPLVGYLEIADAVESSRDSGIWKASYTNDGLHPLAVAFAAIASGLSASVFV